jgi:antitoxin HicB
MATTKPPRRIEGFSTLDDFLDAEGTRETFQAVAIKEVLAWEIEQAMKAQHLSRRVLPSAWARAIARSAV